MQIEKWSHIFVLAAALILLLYLQGRKWEYAGSAKPCGQTVAEEMVALPAMDESNWLLPPYPEIVPDKNERRTAREIRPSGVTVATSAGALKKEAPDVREMEGVAAEAFRPAAAAEASSPAAAVKSARPAAAAEASSPPVAVVTARPAAAAEASSPAAAVKSARPAAAAHADAIRSQGGGEEGARNALRDSAPAVPGAAVKTETAGVQKPQAATRPAKKARSAEEEKNCEAVHREVVRLIRSYLDEQQEMGKRESRPVMLASTQGIGVRSITTAPGVKTAMLRPRYILGMDVGILQPGSRMTPAPKMGMLSELYLGYEFSRLLQLGVCVGYSGVSWPAATPAAPKALYMTHLQVKVFTPEIVKIRPFVQVGVGGQLHAVRTVTDSTAEKVSTSYLTRSLSAGVGGEYKVLSRVALQVVAEYRWNSGSLNKSLRPQHKDHYWQVKAGLSLRLGGGGKVMDTIRSGDSPSGSVANL